jgi:acetylornithine deacetylase/succinyl-diaminopimelate desuccinylase-like protein
MPSEEARAFARQHSQDFEQDLIDFLSIPSISTLQEHAQDCEHAAQWLAGRLGAIGMENVDVIQSPALHPLVYADWLHADGAPTVLVYGHYDVQPVDPLDLWQSPPFKPNIREGYLYARGAVDDKGQVATHLDAAWSYLTTRGTLPINLRFLIEGEEESGGEHIKAFLQSGDARLSADFAQVADSSFFDRDTPSVLSGLRGIVYAEVRVTANRQDLHSGEYGGVAPNPFISLAHIISRLRDDRGLITIPEFYDDVETPDGEELASWSQLDMSEEKLAAEIGARKLIGDPAFSPLERMWSRPTLDVHGMPGGFTSPGAKTVIPAEASAKISMRLVPNQKANRIFELFEFAVRGSAPDDVSVSVERVHGDDPVIVPSDTPAIRAAREAVETVWGRPTVLTRSGGSIPIVGGFLDELGLPTVLLGYGLPGDNLHAPNERFLLDQFHKGIETNIVFWDLVGRSIS